MSDQAYILVFENQYMRRGHKQYSLKVIEVYLDPEMARAEAKRRNARSNRPHKPYRVAQRKLIKGE